MRINLKLVGTFLAVAEHSSFRKAAEQRHLSLPAVSMQIKQLEGQVGVSLFHRTTRKIELTREGEQLMISWRMAMAEIDSGLAQIRLAADLQQGRLAFACVPTVAASRLPMILTTFAKRYPGITLNVREAANKELLEAVRRREVDFGIGHMPEPREDLQFSPIFRDEYCALLARSYSVADRSGITLRELSKLPLLKLSTSTAFREHVDGVLRAHGLPTETNYEFKHVHTLLAMAEAGLGVAVLPRVAVPRRTGLKVVRISHPSMSRIIAIITIKGHSLSPAAARLVELCTEMVPPSGAVKSGRGKQKR
jgi:DNA-binding transcriptional LysR family regulator